MYTVKDTVALSPYACVCVYVHACGHVCACVLLTSHSDSKDQLGNGVHDDPPIGCCPSAACQQDRSQKHHHCILQQQTCLRLQHRSGFTKASLLYSCSLSASCKVRIVHTACIQHHFCLSMFRFGSLLGPLLAPRTANVIDLLNEFCLPTSLQHHCILQKLYCLQLLSTSLELCDYGLQFAPLLCAIIDACVLLLYFAIWVVLCCNN